jgi:hypothetical protein
MKAPKTRPCCAGGSGNLREFGMNTSAHIGIIHKSWNIPLEQNTAILRYRSGLPFVITRGKERPGPPPISTFMKHKHSISFLFVTILSSVLNDPCQTAHPVLEDARDVIKSEVIADPRHGFFDFIAWVELLLLQNSFQHTKELKITWTYVWRMGWVLKSGDVMLLGFQHHLGSIVT